MLVLVNDMEFENSLVVAMPVSKPYVGHDQPLIRITISSATYKQECADSGKESNTQRIPHRHCEGVILKSD